MPSPRSSPWLPTSLHNSQDPYKGECCPKSPVKEPTSKFDWFCTPRKVQAWHQHKQLNKHGLAREIVKEAQMAAVFKTKQNKNFFKNPQPTTIPISQILKRHIMEQLDRGIVSPERSKYHISIQCQVAFYLLTKQMSEKGTSSMERKELAKPASI